MRVHPSAVPIAAVALSLAFAAAAGAEEPPARVAVSPDAAFAFSALPLDVADWSVAFSGEAPPGAAVSLVPGTFAWVRVSETLKVPRARLRVTVRGPAAASLAVGDSVQPLARKADALEAELPVALLADAAQPITLEVKTDEGVRRHPVALAFHPRTPAPEGRVQRDVSCSRWITSVESTASAQADWLYLGCRFSTVEGAEHRTSNLELLVLWEGVGRTLDVGDLATEKPPSGVVSVRLRSEPGELTLKGGARTVTVKYRAPDYPHRLSLGAGLGPYLYRVQSQRDGRLEAVVPLPTLYGSLAFSEETRLVFFDATAVSRRFYTDFGVYLNSESARLLDRRVQFNVVLGAHAIVLRYGDSYRFKLSAPQGVELFWSDLFMRGDYVMAGGFVYPLLNGRSYVNTWLRWGVRGLFVEANYIAWREPVEGDSVSTDSLGLTIGVPLARLF